jgi:phosphatidylserine decarboxylase
MSKPIPLATWDRESRKVQNDWMDDGKSHYESEPRSSPTQWLESQPLFDWFNAALQRTRWSARKIRPFIEKHGIDMNEFEDVTYESYNDFFIRKFRAGVRTFPTRDEAMGGVRGSAVFRLGADSAGSALSDQGTFAVRG